MDIIDLYQGKVESTILTAVKGVLKKAIESLYLDSAYIVRNTKDYLCCFSESDDLLSQWRAYGSDGQGVAIGFNAKLLAEIEDSYQYDFIKVIYGQNDTSENIQEYMEENLKNIFKNLKKEDLNPVDITFNLVPILTPILQERFAFKHPSFKEEREWRLHRKQVGNFDEDSGEEEAFYRGAFHANSDLNGELSCSELMFRSLQNDICTYYELGFDRCKQDMVKKVVLGPKCQINKVDMKLLLRKYMYISDIESKDIVIEKSKVPYV